MTKNEWNVENWLIFCCGSNAGNYKNETMSKKNGNFFNIIDQIMVHRVPVWIGYEPLKIKSQFKNKSTVRLIKTSQTYDDLVFNPESVYYSDLWNVESRLVNVK